MSPSRAPIAAEVLRWARESAGLGLEDAARAIGVPEGRLELAEAGEGQLTMIQARKAARTYARPFALLFLPTPPEEDPADVQFRRLRDAPELPWPPGMRALARRVPDLQDQAAEIFDAIDEPPGWREGEAILDRQEDIPRAAALLREFVGVSLAAQKTAAAQDRQGYRAYRVWREAIEERGLLVLQDGSLELEEMRGFAAPHADVPAIVINTKDDVRARLFTLVHELSHLLWIGGTEERHEQLAGATLMPQPQFEADLRSTSGTLVERVDELARIYATTPDATAVRVAWLGLVPWQDINETRTLIRERGGPRGASGGDAYRNVVARLGPGFVRRILGAVDQSAMSELAAARVLGVRVGTFARLRNEVERPDVA
jgi:Zn-dependent peptidase ImmA (M78 family)